MSCYSSLSHSIFKLLTLSINRATKLSPSRSVTTSSSHTLHHVMLSNVHSLLLSINHSLTSSEQIGVVTVYINLKSLSVFVTTICIKYLRFWRRGIWKLVFRDVAQCSLGFCALLEVVYSSVLKMEATCCPEIFAKCYQATRHCIPEDVLHTHLQYVVSVGTVLRTN